MRISLDRRQRLRVQSTISLYSEVAKIFAGVVMTYLLLTSTSGAATASAAVRINFQFDLRAFLQWSFSSARLEEEEKYDDGDDDQHEDGDDRCIAAAAAFSGRRGWGCLLRLSHKCAPS